MLKSINKVFVLGGLFILLLFLPLLDPEYGYLYLVNLLALFTFYFTLNKPLYKSEIYFTKGRLGYIIFFYSLFYVFLNKVLSYYYRENFFVFSEVDAVGYHEGAIVMASQSFMESIDYAKETWGVQKISIGPFIIISTLYRLIESNLLLTILYIFVGLITSFSIFRIAKNFMSAKYSFLCALTYSTSSFVIWFHSSGLKESFMVMLILLFFDFYYRYHRFKRIKYLLLAIVFLLSITLFRPAVMFLCGGALIISVLLTIKKKKIAFLILLSAVIILIIATYSYLDTIVITYLGGDINQLIAGREEEGMVKGSLPFTYAVNVLSSLAGPLPTVLPNTKQMLSLFSIGLIYRVFMTAAFVLGIFYCIREKITLMYPILCFMLMEMLSLTIILEALELRKSLPHFPFIYIIAFWFLDYYDKKAIDSRVERRRIKYLFNISFALFFTLIVYWNYR